MDERLVSADAIVFDMGNVLISFQADHVARLLPPENRQQLIDVMFGPKKMWGIFDYGLEENEAIARRIAQEAGAPDAWEQIIYVLHHYHEVMDPLPMVKLLPQLRQMGKRLYALTNYPEPSFTLASQAFPFFTQDLDGCVVSAQEKVFKPDAAIFHRLIQRYSLTPEKTLFIDDTEANIRTAQSLGFCTWHYTESDRIC